MHHPRKNMKTTHDDRIILHFDLDCFYAQVFENKTPSLKSLPLGIRQKSLLATCNYPARRLGVKKLMSIASALAICPDLVIVDGEDLTPFRDVSKRLYALLRSFSWNDKVERLGLDEVWMDVSDMVEYNQELLNRNDLEHSWFCLDREDPEKGFGFDGRGFAGCVYGADHFGVEETGVDAGGEQQFRRTKLLLASHLALHLRLKIEEEGYTTACGISTNKLLAKLVGNVNKPRNQTTLLSFGPDGGEETVKSFMGSHQLRKVPGIGGKTAAILSDWFISQSNTDPNATSPLNPKEIFVANLLSCPGLTPPSKLDSLLSSTGTGTGTGTGKQILSLLQGHDPSPVKPARSLPTQISIEDTYHSCALTALEQIRSELLKITASLLKRMKTDLMDDEKKRWLARPKTLRLTTRPRTDPKENKGYGYGRVSKSGSLPGYVFHISNANDDDDGGNSAIVPIVERLVTEMLMPMFRELNPLNTREGKKGYSIGLLNVCVTNMDSLVEAEDGKGKGRDIKDMFMRAREFTVYDHSGGDYNIQDDDNGENKNDHDATTQPESEETIDDMDMDMDVDGGINGEICLEVYNTSGNGKPTSPTRITDYHNDVNHHHQDPDPIPHIPDSYEQDSRIPTTSNEYFHIEDDDEIWDDSENNNMWDNDEEVEEDMDSSMRGGPGGMSDDGIKCPLCNHFIPLFALSAHERFHSMEGEGD